MHRGHAALDGKLTIILTDGDHLVFEWLALVQCSTYEDLAAATGRSVDALHHRLPRLGRAGYLHRRLTQDAHRFTVLWFPTTHATATLRHRTLRMQPADPDHVDVHRAAHLARALLPHFQTQEGSTTIYRGRPLAARIDRLVYTMGMRGIALNPTDDAPHPVPDLLVEHERGLTAIELRLGTAIATAPWRQRLANYALLGVTQLEIHTDLPLLETSLRHAARGLLFPKLNIVHVHDSSAGLTGQL